jgi:hypothetical protein
LVFNLSLSSRYNAPQKQLPGGLIPWPPGRSERWANPAGAPIAIEFEDAMPPRDRSTITKGLFLTSDAGVPASCKGLDLPLGVPYRQLVEATAGPIRRTGQQSQRSWLRRRSG